MLSVTSSRVFAMCQLRLVFGRNWVGKYVVLLLVLKPSNLANNLRPTQLMKLGAKKIVRSTFSYDFCI